MISHTDSFWAVWRSKLFFADYKSTMFFFNHSRVWYCFFFFSHIVIKWNGIEYSCTEWKKCLFSDFSILITIIITVHLLFELLFLSFALTWLSLAWFGLAWFHFFCCRCRLFSIELKHLFKKRLFNVKYTYGEVYKCDVFQVSINASHRVQTYAIFYIYQITKKETFIQLR